MESKGEIQNQTLKMYEYFQDVIKAEDLESVTKLDQEVLNLLLTEINEDYQSKLLLISFDLLDFEALTNVNEYIEKLDINKINMINLFMCQLLSELNNSFKIFTHLLEKFCELHTNNCFNIIESRSADEILSVMNQYSFRRVTMNTLDYIIDTLINNKCYLLLQDVLSVIFSQNVNEIFMLQKIKNKWHDFDNTTYRKLLGKMLLEDTSFNFFLKIVKAKNVVMMNIFKKSKMHFKKFIKKIINHYCYVDELSNFKFIMETFFIIKNSMNENVINESAFHYLLNKLLNTSIIANNIKLLEYVLNFKETRKSVETCSHGKNAIAFAIMNNRIECIKLFLALGINLSLVWRSEFTNKEFVEYNSAFEKFIHENNIIEEFGITDDDIDQYVISMQEFYVKNYLNHFKSITVRLDFQHSGYIKEFNECLEILDKSWISINDKNDRLYKPEINLRTLSFFNSSGQGVLRHILNELSNLLISKDSYVGTSLGLAAIFESNKTTASDTIQGSIFDSNYVFKRDIDNLYMYIPYYYNLIPEDIKFYENFALFLVFVLSTKTQVNLNLSPIFFKYLTNEEIKLEHFLPEYMSRTLNLMESYTQEDFDNLMITMTVSSITSNGTMMEFELVPDGKNIMLGVENFNEYKEALLKFYLEDGQRDTILKTIKNKFYKVTSCIKNTQLSSTYLYMFITQKPEIPHILDWIAYSNFSIIPGLKIFNKTRAECLSNLSNLKNKIIKTEEIDSELISSINFKINRSVKGTIPTEIIWLFQIINDFDSITIKKLLKFMCGTDVLPIGGLKKLYDDAKMICFYVGNLNQNLPSASTCSNSLRIHNYKSKEILEEKLRYVLDNCTQMTRA